MSLYIPDKKPTVVVLGDMMLDHSIYGTSHKIANEGPIPVVHYQRESYHLGGCGNVTQNLLALGCEHVIVFSRTGKDDAARTIQSVFHHLHGTVDYMLIDPLFTTIVKHRVYSDQKLVCRYDEESPRPLTESQENYIIEQLKYVFSVHFIDSVIFSDYNKGFLTPRLCQLVISMCKKKNIPVIVDPKQSTQKYIGCTVIKPNRHETMHLVGVDPEVDLEGAHRALHAATQCENSIITLAEKGISGYGKNSIYRYSNDVCEVIDVTGAGDIVTAVFGAYYSFLDTSTLLRLASYLATLSVQHIGVYTIQPFDLVRSYRSLHRTKCVPLEWLVPALHGKTVLFTNGCFDLLHAAHMKLFQFCRSKGEQVVIVVGVNSDASIRRLKGPTRPVYSLTDRITLLEGIDAIDFIVPFEEDTPLTLIRELHPTYLVKGGDYHIEDIIGREYAKEVILYPYQEGTSTTTTIAKCTTMHKAVGV